MSTKHLQKLREQLGVSQDIPQDVESSSEEETGSFRVPVNPFELLDDNSADDKSESEEAVDETQIEGQDDKDDEELISSNVETLNITAEVTDNSQPGPSVSTLDASGKPKKNKNKNKKKKKKKNINQCKDQEDDDIATTSGLDQQDTNVNVSLRAESGTNGAEGVSQPDLDSLYDIQEAYLKPEKELRQLFGNVAISADARPSRNKSRRGGLPGGPPRSTLVTVRDNWPPKQLVRGLHLERVGMDGSRTVFKYDSTIEYNIVCEEVEVVKNQYNPNQLQAYCVGHFWHAGCIDALCTMYRVAGQGETADEEQARCLYALEAAWPTTFRVGQARLPYSYPSNRLLHHALFRQTQIMSRRGCTRTALELCKLLLSFDPTDPLGACHHLPYLCIRSSQFSYLAKYFNLTGTSLYPAGRYCEAFAKYRLQRDGAGKGGQAWPGEDEGGSGDSAGQVLLQAVLMYPVVCMALIDKLQTCGVAQEKKWEELFDMTLFSNASVVVGGRGGGGVDTRLLEKYARLFAIRHHLLWKQPLILKWLYDIALYAAQLADGIADAKALPADVERAEDVELLATIRAVQFAKGRVRDVSHLSVEDFGDDVIAMGEILNEDEGQ